MLTMQNTEQNTILLLSNMDYDQSNVISELIDKSMKIKMIGLNKNIDETTVFLKQWSSIYLGFL